MTYVRPEDAPDFGLLRPKLRRVAYRMLGSVAEAEDVVARGPHPLDEGRSQ
jgi:RNA polymerase sigma-70 factor (ECF subfamily)